MNALALLAQEDSSGGGAAALLQLGILLLIPLAMYFLMIRPQRRRMREAQALQASLAEGDEVVTTSGIYGTIVRDDGDRFWLEIDDDVMIQVAKAAIQGRAAASSTPAAAAETSLDDALPDDGK